jgi:hypothetical protein
MLQVSAMDDTTRIRLRRYPAPPDLEHYLRVYFKLGESYEVPTELAHALIATGDAVFDRQADGTTQAKDGRRD